MLLDSKFGRYKLLKQEDQYYLLDVDQNKLFWLLPTFTWYQEMEACEISEEDYEKLHKPYKQVKQKKHATIGGVSVTGVGLGRILFIFSERVDERFFQNVSFAFTIIAYLLTLILCFSIRSYISCRNIRELKKMEIQYKSRNKFKIIKLGFYYKKYLRDSFFIFLAFSGGSIGLSIIFFIDTSTIIYAMMVTFIILPIFANSFFKKPYYPMEWELSRKNI